MTKKIAEEDFDSRLHIKEYKRKCKQCGKIWHSLASREKKIESNIRHDAFQICANCCNPSAQLQAKRSVEAEETTLNKLKQCPKCSSSNYKEEVLIYEKQ